MNERYKKFTQKDVAEAIAEFIADIVFLFVFWYVWNNTFVDIMPVQSITLWQALVIFIIARFLLNK